jgi:uncharacterized protein
MELFTMKRDLLNNLNEWKNSNRRKPLILRGARQVGKSWLAKELGRSFSYFAEINFDRNPELGEFFITTKDPKKLISLISDYLDINIIPGETLLFLDEIQNCPNAIKALRYFYEELPQLHVLAAGSLLEFELQNISIPVGRIQFLYCYPLSFAEFLTATGKQKLRERLLENGLNPLPNPLHTKLLKLVRIYTIIGGLPEVVTTYCDTDNLRKCSEIQSDILLTYRKDFHKYAKKHQIKYLEKLFTALPLQVGNKFKYANIDNNLKSRELSESLELLVYAGVIHKIHHTSANGIPLKAEMELKKFKAVFFDTGLMLNLLHFDFTPLLLNPDITLVNNGALAEHFVAQELLAYANPRIESELFYWHREKKSSNAEIDYVIEYQGNITPIEVKSGSTGSMKSLAIFLSSKPSKTGIKISSYPFSLSNNIQTIPFYAIEAMIKSE